MAKTKIKDLNFYISDGNYSSKYPRSNEFVEKGIPFIRCNNFKNNTISSEDMYYITEEKHGILLKGHVKSGDVLITTRGSLGQVTIVPPEYDDANINAQIVLIRMKNNKINNRYLMWQLRSNGVQNQILKLKTGTALQQLPVGRLLNIELSIEPNLDRQICIADILDTIQATIDLRNKQINQLDELIKSQFVEMFGNVKSKMRLGDCCDVHARIGWQALTKDEHMKTGDYMLITGTDFKDNEIDYSTCVYVSKERYEMDQKIILRENDILVTKDGTIGKVAIVHNLVKPSTLNSGVFVIRPNKLFNKEYIAYVFKGPLFEEFVNKSKIGATIKHLNQKHLVEFEIPLPSLEEQEHFAKIYKQIDKQKFEMQKSLEEMQNLYDSLMAEYFE